MDGFQLIYKEHLQEAHKDKLDNNALWWQGELVSTSSSQQILIENRFCGDGRH
jgi:hypothetical protein